MSIFRKSIRLVNLLTKKYPIFLALIILWLVLSIISKSFLTLGNIINIFIQSTPIALMAIGGTFVIITGEVDLAVAGVLTLSACIVALLMVNFGLNPILAIIITVILSTLIGVIIGLFVYYFQFPAFISSLGLSSAVTGLALIVTGGYSIHGFSKGFIFIAQGTVFKIPVPIIIITIAFILASLILNRTNFGLSVFAVGGNMEAARLSGINVGRIKLISLMIGSFMSGIAGIITAARMDSAQPLVPALGLDVIAAIVIGGTSLLGGIGSMSGTFVGVLILGTIRNGLNLLGVSPSWQMVSIAGVILLAVYVDYLGRRKSLT